MDLYLKEPRLSKKQNPKLEVLPWWKEHYNGFPELFLMAQDLMSTRKTNAFESSFSIGKKIITPYLNLYSSICPIRHPLLPLLCAKGANVALFKGLLHINTVKKLAAKPLMRWLQLSP